jgi:hypothetical protein
MSLVEGPLQHPRQSLTAKNDYSNVETYSKAQANSPAASLAASFGSAEFVTGTTIRVIRDKLRPRADDRKCIVDLSVADARTNRFSGFHRFRTRTHIHNDLSSSNLKYNLSN